MADIGEPYQFACPLCGHLLQMAAHSEEMCRYCGAELVITSDERAAYQYAEELKRHADSVELIGVPGRAQWVVAHKSTPHGMHAREE